MNKKKTITTVLAFLILIAGFLALAFNLTHYEITFFGTTVEEGANGFSVMSEYPAILEDIGGWLCAYSIISIVCYAIMLVLFAIMTLRKSVHLNKVCIATTISSIVLTLIYMINGFATNSIVKEELIDTELYSFAKLNSASFIPFIIVAVLAIAYIAAAKLLPENNNNTAEEAKTEETAEK